MAYGDLFSFCAQMRFRQNTKTLTNRIFFFTLEVMNILPELMNGLDIKFANAAKLIGARVKCVEK